MGTGDRLANPDGEALLSFSDTTFNASPNNATYSFLKAKQRCKVSRAFV